MTITLEQQKQNRKLWVEALRSGQYAQARGTLMCDEGFCCLGVACVVAGVDEKIIKLRDNLNGLGEVMSIFGLRDADGDYYDEGGTYFCLAEQNDRGMSFAEIADIIESEPHGLFINKAEG